MLTFWETSRAGSLRCSRRAVLQVGALGFGGFTLADWCRRRAQAAPGATPSPADATAVIHVFLGGGPSHIDTFDLKPNAPAEIRGEFLPIASNVPGVQLCEHLPHLARVMDRMAVVRSVAHGNAGHLPASHWMVTGYEPPQSTTTNVNPYCGAIAARFRGPVAPQMPAYVSIPKRQLLGAAAYLGPSYNPFTPESDPAAERFQVRNLNFPRGLDASRLETRTALRHDLDRLRGDLDRFGESTGIDRFTHEAFALVSGDRARSAFDIASEDPALRERYGHTPMGQRCLLARRLVEAGATFVTVLGGGEWDTHVDNFVTLKNRSLPPFDQGLAALVSDLAERGLDRRVLVLVSGEFGRTPTINKRAGRDHWPGAISVLFAGGGMRMGQAIGATDSRGRQPVSHRYSPGDVLATVYGFLGIDPRQEIPDHSGRPVRILSEGAPISELLA